MGVLGSGRREAARSRKGRVLTSRSDGMGGDDI